MGIVKRRAAGAARHVDQVLTFSSLSASKLTTPPPTRLVVPLGALVYLLAGGLVASASTDWVVIDRSVSGWEAIVAASPADTELLLVGADGANGWQELESALAGRSNSGAIHILGHGLPGEALLGSGTLSSESLEGPVIRTLTEALADGGSLYLYGCLVAEGAGAAFVDALSDAIGAPVRASTDWTGNVSSGGNWELEYAAGDASASALFSDEGVAGFPYLLQGALSISGLTPVVYLEQGPAVALGEQVTVTGGGSYADGYLEYAITGATASETLGVITQAQPSMVDGQVTVVGGNVYLGTGGDFKQIGSVDATRNGQNGMPLRINFSSPLENSDFSGGLQPNGDPVGWTINKQVITLGSLASKTQGRPVSIANNGDGTFTVSGQGYSFVTDFFYDPNAAGTNGTAWATEGVEITSIFQGSSSDSGPSLHNASVTSHGGRAEVLRIWFSGWLDSSVKPSGNPPYGSTFGGDAWSSPFQAAAGDSLAFDWSAANGGDDYEVYGFIVNTQTNVHTELFYGRGNIQSWRTVSGTIPADGEYRFRFVTGSYDRTGGRALGASLYIDNARVLPQDANEEVTEAVARFVTYANTSKDPAPERTLTVSAVNSTGHTDSDSTTITITLVNDPPEVTATSLNPAYAPGGPNASLFSNASITAIEADRLIERLVVTVSGVDWGLSEYLIVDGTPVPLVTGQVQTATNGYTVDVVGTDGVATLTITRLGNYSVVMAQALINGLNYRMDNPQDEIPRRETRTVALVEIQDNGGTANNGEDTSNLSIASTVTISTALPSVGSLDVTSGMTLHWAPVPEAISYRVIVSSNPDLTNPEFDQSGITDTFVTVSPPLPGPTTYYWTVIATMPDSSTVTGPVYSFATIQTYTLSYSAGPDGSLSGPTTQTVDIGADGQAVTAVPDSEEYFFLEWSDGLRTNPRVDANVTEDLSLVATFEEVRVIWVSEPVTIGVYGDEYRYVLFAYDAAFGEPVTYQGANLPPGLTITELDLIETMAGNGTHGSAGDAGAAVEAELRFPHDVALASDGTMYIADSGNGLVRRVQPDGSIDTIAGGVGGTMLAWPAAVALSPDEHTLYIADQYGDTVFALDLTGPMDQVLSVLAGSGSFGFAGDGGHATQAQLASPAGLAVATNGDVYIADQFNDRIRVVDHNTGDISTYAGTGTPGYNGDGMDRLATNLNGPTGLAFDGNGNLFIADRFNNRVRVVVAGLGEILTAAGTGNFGFSGDGGPAKLAELNFPQGVALDAFGRLYISDTENSRVRMVNDQGTIRTIAGNGNFGHSGDGGEAKDALLNYPAGIAVDETGSIYFADVYNNRVRRIRLSSAILSGTPTLAGDYAVTLTASNSVQDRDQDFLLEIAKAPAQVFISNLAHVYDGAARAVSTSTSPEDFAVVVTYDGIGTAPSDAGTYAVVATIDDPNWQGVASDTLSITQAELTITASDRGKTFGELVTFAGSEFSAVGLVNGETIGEVSLVSAGAAASAGVEGNPYTITASNATGGSFNTANYTIAYVDGTLTVDRAPLTLSAVNLVKTYGEVLVITGSEFTVSGLVGNDTINRVNGGSDGTVATAGVAGSPYAFGISHPEFGAGSENNYEITFVSASLTVTPANATVTANNQVKTYGDTFVFDGTEFVSNGLVNGETINAVLLTSDGAASSATVADGPYAILPSNASGGSFDPVNYKLDYQAGLMTLTEATQEITFAAVADTLWTETVLLDATASSGLPVSFTVLEGPATIDDGVVSFSLYDTVVIEASQDGDDNWVAAEPVVRSFVARAAPKWFSTPVTDVVAYDEYSYILEAFDADGWVIDFEGGEDTDWLSLVQDVRTRMVRSVAGNGEADYLGDGAQAMDASLNRPSNVAIDSTMNVYIADTYNHVVRRVKPNGLISTVAGTGVAGYSGDGGNAANATLRFPAAVALDAAGNLYIADRDNHRVRMVDADGVISTVAGIGAAGFTGDGGAATSARLNRPNGVALDAEGNLYIADRDNHRVRMVDSDGDITTTAGTGTPGYGGDGGPATSAMLRTPNDVTVDSNGTLYIADRDNHRVRRVGTNGVITTVAGTGTLGFSGDDGIATDAQLNKPYGISVDGQGRIYIADTDNHRIRMIDLDGTIVTIAGDGTAGNGQDDVLALETQFNAPFGIAADPNGHVFIADNNNHRVRRLGPGQVRLEGTPTLPGDYEITLYADDGYYQTPQAFTITVAKATPIVDEWPTAGALVYGQPLGDSALTGGSASIPARSISGTFAFNDPDTRLPFGNHTVSVTFSPDEDHVFEEVSGTVDVSVSQKEVTLPSLAIQDKIYDGSGAATVADYGDLDQLEQGDNVTLDASGALATYADALAGLGKSVEVTGLALSGAESGNYFIGAQASTGSILPKALTLPDLIVSEKVYDGTTDALIGQYGELAGLVGLDSVQLNPAVASFDSPDAASSVVVSITGLTLTGADAANYVIEDFSTTATIHPALLTISVNDAARDYRGPDPVFGFADFSTALVSGDTEAEVTGGAGGAGDVSYTLADTDANSPVGVYTNEIGIDAASVNGPKASNYTIAVQRGALEILPVMTVSTYSDLLDALTNPDVTSIVLDSDISGSAPITIDRPLTLEGQGHTIDFGIGIAAEDVVVTNLGIEIDAPAGDPVWANCSGTDAAICLAHAVVDSEGNVTGLAHGAKISMVDISVSGDGHKDAIHIGPGNGGVVVSQVVLLVQGGAESSGIALMRGAELAVLSNVTIIAAPVALFTEIAIAGTMNTTTVLGTVENVTIGQDVVTVVSVYSEGQNAIEQDSAAARTVAVAPGIFGLLHASGVAPASGEDLYSVFPVNGGQYRYQHFDTDVPGLAIDALLVLNDGLFQQAIVIQVNDASRQYGAAIIDPGFADFTDQLRSGDTMADVVGGAGSALDVLYEYGSVLPNSPIGLYPDTIGIVAASVNGPQVDRYSVTIAQGELTIIPREVTVTPNDASKVYGDADLVLSFAVTAGSLVADDAFTGVLSRQAGESVGSYPIEQGSLSAGANYALTVEAVQFFITPREVQVSGIEIAPKPYDGTVDAVITDFGSLQGVLDGDAVVLVTTNAHAQFDDPAVGVNKPVQVTGLVLAGAQSTNYTLATPDASGTITPVALSVAAQDQWKLEGAGDPALTYAVVSGQLVGADALAGTLGRESGEAAGEYAILQGSLDAGGNYTLAFEAGRLTILSETSAVIAAYPVALTADQVVPATGSTAIGVGVVLHYANGMIEVRIEHNVAGATGVALHEGAPGVNGPLVRDLGAGSFPVSVLILPPASETIDLGNTPYYLTIASNAFASGEIRGAIDYNRSAFQVNLLSASAVQAAAGESVQLEVATDGVTVGGVTYRWFHQAPGGEVQEVDGANGSVLILSQLVADDSGTYFAEVSDDLWTVESGAVALTVEIGGNGDGDIEVVLTGTLFHSQTLQPVTCAIVELTASDHSFRVTAAADANGVYRFEAQPADFYTVRILAPGYQVVEGEGVELFDDEEMVEIDFLLTESAVGNAINGQITDDESGLPLVGVLVQLFIQDAFVADTHSCADGRYELPLPGTDPSGEIAIQVRYSLENFLPAQRNQVVNAGTGAVINATLKMAVTATGRMTGRVLGTDGVTPLPLGQARVTLRGPVNTTIETDEDGQYTVEQLIAGSYSVTASIAGYAGKSVQSLLVEDAEREVNFLLMAFEQQFHPADINRDGAVNAVDVQMTINAALGIVLIGGHNADINGDGAVNAVDVQLVINEALGIDIAGAL